MDITLQVEKRPDLGRGGARRLRRAGQVPAIIYGDGDPMAITCSARQTVAHMQDDSFRSSLLVLEVGGKKIKALLREVQMHPFRREILHLDFQAVREDSEIAAQVPLHFINIEDSPGVKLHHGIFTTIENQAALHCLPKDLPESIDVNVGGLEIGKSIHLSDITPPPGVRFDAIVRGEDPALAIISEPRAEKEETGTPDSADSSETKEADA